MSWVISKYQAAQMLDAVAAGKGSAESSADLGVSPVTVSLKPPYAVIDGVPRLSFEQLEIIAADDTCYLVEEEAVSKISFFLKETGRVYKLFATGLKTPPTAEISGIRMHRTKGIDPWADTLEKLKSLGRIRGRVLDCCMGLGYTAIASLKAGAEEVYTVEEDEGMRMLAKINPWSFGLQDDRIKKIAGDVSEVVKGFSDSSFDAIIHDPPRMALAGHLYSLEFYSQLYRVMKAGGRLYHYVGSPGGRYRSKDIPSGVAKRLKAAGFTGVREESGALGVSAGKS